jgi:hypothetical protein
LEGADASVAKVKEAMAYLETGHAKGKVVLVMR